MKDRIDKLLDLAEHERTPPAEAQAARKKITAIRQRSKELVAIPVSQDDLDGADLGELAVIANKFHDEVKASGDNMVVAAWSAGQTLLTAKEMCEHGEWLPWLEANFKGSERTAQRYMAIASKTTRVSDLEKASIRGALETISLKDKLDDEPSPKPKGKRGRAKTPSQKFEKRCIALSDDISFIVHTAEKDDEFAAAARNCWDGLLEQRDELTALIENL